MTKIDTSALAYDFLDAQSRSIDWDAARREDGEGVTVHMPAITREVLEEYGHEPEAFDVTSWIEDNITDYLTADRQQELVAALGLEEHNELPPVGAVELAEIIAAHDAWKDAPTFRAAADQLFNEDEAATIANALEEAKEEHDEQALEEETERFQGSDDWYEWQDSMQPAMNFIWPCEPFRIDDEGAATLINELAGSTSLVTITPPDDSSEDETQGIVLTGGGMDLSWDICAAYICCGQIPPTRLLIGLPRFAGHTMSPMAKAVLECIDLCADWHEARAQRLRQERASLEDRLTK